MDYLKKNYHTHTTRCGHAVGTEREYIENAIKSGIEVLGFADHTPYPYLDPNYVSGVRMGLDKAQDYVDTLRTLREEYKNDVKILIGFEAEYYPLCFPAYKKLVDDLGIDYLILGQHFTNNEYDGTYIGRNCSDEMLESYINNAICAMESGYYSYVAHPDVVNYTRDEYKYRMEMTKLCKKAKELDIPLEINFLGLGEGRRYPTSRFFDIAAEIGNTVIYGVDAHTPEAFFDKDTFAAAEKFRKDLGLELTDEIRLIKR